VKILVVEDHPRLGPVLRQSLAENSYTTELVTSCEAAKDALAESAFDVIVLDLGLPDGDGLGLLREWRESGFNEPVIILSARDTLSDRVNGLDFGADDYLAKPFSSEELLARIRALVRRQSAVKLSVLEHRGLKLDLRSHVTELHGKPVCLTSREFAILEIFMLNPGRVLTRSLISEKIWPSNYDIDMNLLDVYMSRLRGKLEHAPDTVFFKTMRGVGYQLI
jgi:DNA-binding response OmpR family regulator